jgi:N-acetyl-alpha-D-glucosaminyl L-malate synthase BshA
MVRIGIVCYPTFGGSGVVATELGRWLAHGGHEVHFMSYDRPFRLSSVFEENLHFHKVELLDYPVFPSPSYTLSLGVKIAEIARDHKLEIVHVHYAVPHAVSAYLARQMCSLCKVAVVTTLHGTDITLVGSHPAALPAVRFAIEQSDAVTAVSKWLRDHTYTELGVTRSIDVVPNFVDAELFRRHGPNCPMQRILAGSDKAILHVSNFRPVKRVRDIVKAFAIVRKKVDARLIMVGDGPDRPAAEELARELGVLPYMNFPGRHSSIQCFYSIADLFVFASEYESFGLAALEAMSSEVPVVAYRGGGLPEVVDDGETGRLVEPDDIEAMGKAMVELLADSERAKQMGRRAREIVLEKYQPEQIVGQYEAIYHQAIEARKTAQVP